MYVKNVTDDYNNITLNKYTVISSDYKNLTLNIFHIYWTIIIKQHYLIVQVVNLILM